jgi:anti-sigma factor RsiW
MKMSCAQFDWKAYALGELNIAERKSAEAHAKNCEACHEELASLRVTLDAMATLRDEEMPRRIAFVSDKVFEPRWYQRLWSPTFAGAMVLAAAILVHGFVRPSAAGSVDQAQIDAAVTKAVAQAEAKHQEQMEQVVAAYDVLRKQFLQAYVQNSSLVRQ